MSFNVPKVLFLVFNPSRAGGRRIVRPLALSASESLHLVSRISLPQICTGYLSDVGTPPPFAVGDFAAWFEAWIGGRWHIFDPRNNVPRMGRVLMARGRDACDDEPGHLAGTRLFALAARSVR